MAKGCLPMRGVGSPKVAITFGQELINQINAICVKDNISFAEAVRRICWKHFDQAEG